MSIICYIFIDKNVVYKVVYKVISIAFIKFFEKATNCGNGHYYLTECPVAHFCKWINVLFCYI